MKSLNRKLPLFLLLLTIASMANANMQFKLDSELSSVAFTTTKLQYVIEPARFDSLSGRIDEQGILNVAIGLASVKTGVDIRNQRLSKLFFNTEDFPQAQVTASVPENVLASENLVSQQQIPAKVTLFGNTQELRFSVNVVKTPEIIAISTVTPVMVRGSAFGIPTDNLTRLAKTVGGIPISDTVPVTFSLILRK